MVPNRSRAGSGRQDWGIVLHWNSFARKSCSHHKPHMHSHPEQGVSTTQLGISAVHIQLHLSREIKKYNIWEKNVMQRVKLNRCICSSSHWACAVLAAFLSRKDLPITVSQTSIVTTFEQRGNLYHHLYLALWEFSAEASELFTITDGAAACIGDRVRAEGGRTWSSGTSHWTTLQEMKHNMLTKENNRQEAYANVCGTWQVHSEQRFPGSGNECPFMRIAPL